MKKILHIFTADKVIFGFILGFIAPFVGLYGYYFFTVRSIAENYFQYLEFLYAERSLLTSTITFSLLANAVLFTIYVNTDRYQTAKGIFIMTMIYAVPLVLLKYIL